MVLDNLISERRLPLKGLGLMVLIKLRTFDSNKSTHEGILEPSSFRGQYYMVERSTVEKNRYLCTGYVPHRAKTFSEAFLGVSCLVAEKGK